MCVPEEGRAGFNGTTSLPTPPGKTAGCPEHRPEVLITPATLSRHLGAAREAGDSP